MEFNYKLKNSDIHSKLHQYDADWLLFEKKVLIPALWQVLIYFLSY
jgi:hypothetical protein